MTPEEDDAAGRAQVIALLAGILIGAAVGALVAAIAFWVAGILP